MSEDVLESEAAAEVGETGRPERSGSRRRLLIAGVAASALVAAGVVAGSSLHDDSPALPLLRPQATFGLAMMTAGETVFSLATPSIEEPGKEVRILSVEAARSDNVEYLGAFASWPRDHGGLTYTGGPGFPNLKHQPKSHPIDAVIPATETAWRAPGDPKPQPVRVTVGFRLLAGQGAVNGVTIVYMADGKTKRVHFRHAVTGCVKPDCQGWGEDDHDENLLRRLGLIKD
ncbi:MAG: hypothetical protein ACT4QG_09100 [Sporichthyaceae bacterium]